MNITSQIMPLRNLSGEMSLNERADFSCRLAKKLEKAGEYEAATEALIEFWPDRYGQPRVDGLEEAVAADVLLRVGALAGWLGKANQAEGMQETAKNLITQSVEIFEKLGQLDKAGEAFGDLALCYWRQGAFDEARINLAEGLRRLSDQNPELKAVLLIRAGIVEVDSQRLDQALRFYDEAVPFVERTEDHALKGSFHIEYGLVLRRLATPDNREDYLDRALIEYSAASYHFEQAGNQRALARVENNLGFLYFTIGRYAEAHRHLDRARDLFLKLKDTGTVAQVDETRARTLLAEGRVSDAERLARSAVKGLQKSDEQAVHAEALTTYGIVKARLGKFIRSRELFERAFEIALTAGDLEGAGHAKLSVIEELAAQTSPLDLANIYESAVDLLRKSQEPSSANRLIACARIVVNGLRPQEQEGLTAVEPTWEGFSLKQHVRAFEKSLIERALRDSGGAVTKAARLLGFRHHQSLISLINGRHRDLLGTRSAVRKRRRPLLSKPRKQRTKAVASASQS